MEKDLLLIDKSDQVKYCKKYPKNAGKKGRDFDFRNDRIIEFSTYFCCPNTMMGRARLTKPYHDVINGFAEGLRRGKIEGGGGK